MSGTTVRADGRWQWGAGLLLMLTVCAVLIPAVSTDKAAEIGDVLATRLTPPLARDATGEWHWLGTDAFGRDVLRRLWQAARVSLSVGVAGSLLSGVLGVALGAGAAWYGGVVDRIISAVANAMLAVPRLVLLLVIAALWGPGITVVVTVLALTGWMSVMRLVRADVQGVALLSYIEGATALGVPSARVLWRHILPNALGSATVAVTLGIGNAILLESGLSFLGLGIRAPAASWGSMIAGGREWLLVAPWIALIPGITLIVTVVACTLIGDALVDRSPAASRDGV